MVPDCQTIGSTVSLHFPGSSFLCGRQNCIMKSRLMGSRWSHYSAALRCAIDIYFINLYEFPKIFYITGIPNVKVLDGVFYISIHVLEYLFLLFYLIPS